MSKTISNNQPTSTVTSTATIPVPEWTTDYRTAADKAGDVEIVSISAPLDAQTNAVFKSNTVPNIYKGAGASIPGTLRGNTVTGVKLLNQRNETWTVTDSVDATYKVSLPVSCHVVLNIPNESLITESDVYGLINRTVGQFYEVVDSKASSRLSAMLRQALVPSKM